jgi:hypothetical protein
MSDNFPNISTDGGDMSFRVRDPMNTALDMDDAGLPPMGKTKISKTDLSGPSGKPQGANYDDSMASSKEFFMPSMAPTGENSSGIPAAKSTDPLTFGDPNDSSLDFRDGSDPNTVTIPGKSGDIERHGFESPSTP